MRGGIHLKHFAKTKVTQMKFGLLLNSLYLINFTNLFLSVTYLMQCFQLLTSLVKRLFCRVRLFVIAGFNEHILKIMSFMIVMLMVLLYSLR